MNHGAVDYDPYAIENKPGLWTNAPSKIAIQKDGTIRQARESDAVAEQDAFVAQAKRYSRYQRERRIETSNAPEEGSNEP